MLTKFRRQIYNNKSNETNKFMIIFMNTHTIYI